MEPEINDLSVAFSLLREVLALLESPQYAKAIEHIELAMRALRQQESANHSSRESGMQSVA
ncbi:hypothetical protein D8W47_25000 [Salmonella enterica]|nr:hypothetical protein [Salmonella enterica]ECE0326007.1 hypothetical protein [Salmonella enterica subsp. enterica]EAB1716140.1 hypothetical protein [Salmonella enterica]EAB1879186.1 hypothetical protein [Salmonella enterica]EAB1976194.1 hypothetical protein [Salmonella enterica]|tara:strand:- start:387 stop:569 length:183 start_codon:yes stop_codon:yes gene_type:complete